MTAAQRPGLWSYVFKLLRLQWVIFFTGFRRARPRRKIGTLLLLVLALAAFTGSLFLTRFLISLMHSPALVAEGVDLTGLLNSIPVLVVSGTFLGILVTSFGLLLQALYLSNDMDFLLSAPIPIRAVFLAKMLQAILPNFLLLLLAGLPVLFGLGAASGYHPLYYPLVLVVLALLALAAAGISSLLVMAIVHIFPARRVAEVLGFVGAIFAILASQWNNLRGHQNSGELTPAQIAAGAEQISRFTPSWSPLAWGGRGLVALGERHWLTGALFLGLILAAAGAVFWIALTTSQRLYYSGWASLQVGTRRKRAVRAAQPPGSPATGLLSRIPSQVRAILFKDWLEMRRNLANLSHLVTPLIMGIVFSVMMLRGGDAPPAGRGEAPAVFMEALGAFISYGSMAVSLFVGWTLLSRLALMAFSMESRSYWILKSSPVSGQRLLASKFLMAYLPALAVGWLFLLANALLQKAPVSIVLYSLASVALILAGLAGINLTLGVRGVNFNWTDPRRMTSGTMGCLGMIGSMGYMGLTFLLFFGPPIAASLLGIRPVLGQAAGLVVGGAVTLLSMVIPLKKVVSRVDRLGEE